MPNTTSFIKEEFTWDGIYLMYGGEFPGAPLMNEVYPDCHPSKIGKVKPFTIARFKSRAKPWKAWVAAIVDNYTVEEYLAESKLTSPLEAMYRIGYCGRGQYIKNTARTSRGIELWDAYTKNK